MNANDLLTDPSAGTFCAEVAEYVKGKRFHVTGGGGTIGSAVVDLLIEYGAKWVAAIDRDEGRLCKVNPGAARCLFDVSGTGTRTYPATYGEPCDVVIHCAAYKHVDGLQSAPCEAMHNNVTATQNVAEWCRSQINPVQMVYLSTDKAIAPVGVLGLTKALGEHVARSIANARIVRLVNVIGSSGSVTERWEKQVASGEAISICNPSHERHYITERNAANTVLSSLLGPEQGVYIPSWYETISTGTLADRFIAACGGTWKITEDRPGERRHEPVMEDGHDALAQYGTATLTGVPVRSMAVQEVG